MFKEAIENKKDSHTILQTKVETFSSDGKQMWGGFGWVDREAVEPEPEKKEILISTPTPAGSEATPSTVVQAPGK